MAYIELFIACAFFALQFIFTKLFEARTRSGLSVSLWNQVICSLTAMLFLTVKPGAWQEAVPGSVWAIAAGYSLSMLACSVASIFAMTCGPVATVGTFSLAGGMLLPFVFGIAVLGETAGPGKWAGMAILCLSLLPALAKKSAASEPADRQTVRHPRLRFGIICFTVFLTNGLVSIFSKVHQISPKAISEDGFILLCSALRCACALLLMLTLAAALIRRGDRQGWRKTFVDIGKKPTTGILLLTLTVCSAAYAVCNTLGNLFSLACMKRMDASLQFPLLSATVIVLTALFGRLFFREKITKPTALSLLLSVAGIVVFML